MQARLVPVMLLLASIAASGCFDDMGSGTNAERTPDASSPSPSPSSTPDTSPAPPVPAVQKDVTVELREYTPEPSTETPLEIEWEILFHGCCHDPNVSKVELLHAASSHPLECEEVQYGGGRSSCITSNHDEPGYGNSSTVTPQGAAPYNVTLQFEDPQPVFFRVRVIADNVSHWTNETRVDVVAPPAAGTLHTVNITGALFAATYVLPYLSITVGDQVEWMNQDLATIGHTATSDPDAPQAFTTGTVAGGATSAPVVFSVAGTYSYHCVIHASMVGARIVVVEAA